MALLEVQDLVAGYGKIEILHGVSLSLQEGTLCAIVGANGAGKTTLLRTISAVIPKRSGSIRFEGDEITRMPSHAIVRRGIAHVPEGRRMLAHMTVEENLLVAGGAASGIAEMFSFVAMVLVGFVYAWKKGALEWEK